MGDNTVEIFGKQNLPQNISYVSPGLCSIYIKCQAEGIYSNSQHSIFSPFLFLLILPSILTPMVQHTLVIQALWVFCVINSGSRILYSKSYRETNGNHLTLCNQQFPPFHPFPHDEGPETEVLFQPYQNLFRTIYNSVSNHSFMGLKLIPHCNTHTPTHTHTSQHLLQSNVNVFWVIHQLWFMIAIHQSECQGNVP